MKRVGVILAGCGVLDGSEIHEAVLTLLYLDRDGADVQCFAPDKPQMHVVNHLTKQPVDGETRNVLVEAARIARGQIKPLSELRMEDIDAVIIPGGFGAAKNLCTYATQGVECEIDSDMKQVIQEAVAQGKVVGAICISPVVVAKALQEKGLHPKLTIGTDPGTNQDLADLGAEAIDQAVNEIIVDETLRIVTTPAYMLGPSISHVALGIKKLVDKVLEL
ncbi:MAG: isoprenoid biosynthesis glyoxalase ElbB [bacterium]|jgi:enhancing lycopene biosynthesis protein 2|nr:isoprenoid biosynthesis glyoxalase ElbB [bacterium]